MGWTEAARTVGNILERDFTLTGDNGNIPGVYWSPAESNANALVLLGHGGTRHKKVDYIVGVAEQLAARGIASCAIDGPGHGERSSGTDQSFEEQWETGGGTTGMLADWQRALDFICLLYTSPSPRDA